ncbi:unnamed protein product [Peniophora sp. CBMAI 1063]|nr:unnamed protein product [Peniophora sp. CBMAI 1063]
MLDPFHPKLWQIADPLIYNVRGPSHEPATNTFAKHNNPHNATPPFFQVFQPAFLANVLSPQATIIRIAYDPDFAFAHESPIWIRESDELWFSSNDGGALGRSDWDNNNVIGKISLREVDAAIEALRGENGAVNVPVTFVDFPDTIQMTNGGTNYKDDLLFITSGRAYLPPSMVRANPRPPYNTIVLLDNFHGRQFNSLNDIKVHPTTGAIFFTDSTYGWLNHFRPEPLLPNMVYRLDPHTGDVRAVADGFVRCNGLAFSGDGKTAYVSDTGAAGGFLGRNHTRPSTIHAYDVDPHTSAWTNRRLFAYADAGVPDGIQVDKLGNVYSACADGVHVWDSHGSLIGKFFLGTSSANMAFVGEGKLAILAETAVYLVQGLRAEGLELDTY